MIKDNVYKINAVNFLNMFLEIIESYDKTNTFNDECKGIIIFMHNHYKHLDFLALFKEKRLEIYNENNFLALKANNKFIELNLNKFLPNNLLNFKTLLIYHHTKDSEWIEGGFANDFIE